MGRLLRETPFSEILATLEVLDRRGVNRDDLTRIRSSHWFARDLADFIRQREEGIESIFDRARNIMGKNFFGVEEAMKHFGINPIDQPVAIPRIPFSEAVLEESKHTHVLTAVFPLSILEMRGKQGDTRLFRDPSWYNQEVFAKERGEANWHLVRKTSVENSLSKTWGEQQALLSKDEETPSARVMTYVIIGHYLATGERLFKSVWVRTSSLCSVAPRVTLGDFGRSGLSFGHGYDISRYAYVGLASARKF